MRIVLEKIWNLICRRKPLACGDRELYRAYRATVLSQLASTNGSSRRRPPLPSYLPQSTAALGAPRAQIEAFRSFVYHNHLRDRNQRPSDARLVAQALRMQRAVPVYSSIRNVLGFWALGAILPEKRRIALASHLLRAVGTEPGRQHLYEKFLCHLVGRRGKHGPFETYLSKGLQLALLRIDGFASQEQLHSLAGQPVDLLRASLMLGICSPSHIESAIAPIKRAVSAKPVLILVQEGILKTDFAAIMPHLDASKSHWGGPPEIDESDFLDTVRLLKAAMVPHADIASLISSNRRFDSERLQNIMAILRINGISDIATVFAGLGPRLWSIECDVLRFAFAHLKVTDATLLVQFAPLLREYSPPGHLVIDALFALGATPSNLVECQALIVEANKIYQPAVEHLATLMGPPYNLGFGELNSCAPYLRRDLGDDSRFGAFLALLDAHRLNAFDAIRHFSGCFESFGHLDGFDLRLRIAKTHLPSLPISDIANWIRANGSGNQSSLRYLGIASGLELPSLDALNKAVDLANVSANLLRYLVQERSMNNITRLHRWYYKEGIGVGSYHGGEEYDSIDRILFEDCSSRKRFYRLHDNVMALVNACWDHANRTLGPIDREWSDVVRSEYFSSRTRIVDSAKQQAAKFIPEVLNATGGTLLKSMLNIGIAGGDFAASLQELKPAMAGLMQGAGPTSDHPSDLEADCISIVYGTSESTIRKHWRGVRGYEQHLLGLKLEPAYRVNLRQERFKLKLASPAHAQAFEGNLRTLTATAAMVKEMVGNSWTDKIRDLPRKQLQNNAATPRELWKWFAFVLHLGTRSEAVQAWIDYKLEAMSAVLVQPELAKAHFEEFEQFIRVTLPDAIGPAANATVESLGDPAETYPVRRRRANETVDLPTASGDATASAIAVVIAAYSRWIVSVKRQFDKQEENDILQAVAVVSKHPSAFFARDAFELCSSNDTDMWSEKRHSHLLIFDHGRQRLIGMAMVYFQSIPGFFGGETCVVVRAVNTRAIEGIQLESTSFIDEVMRVAIKIGQDNGFAAVLFPQSSTHFSNQRELERAVEKAAATRKARPISSPHPIFYCRANGANDGAVSTLFVAWAKAAQAAH